MMVSFVPSGTSWLVGVVDDADMLMLVLVLMVVLDLVKERNLFECK